MKKGDSVLVVYVNKHNGDTKILVGTVKSSGPKRVIVGYMNSRVTDIFSPYDIDTHQPSQANESWSDSYKYLYSSKEVYFACKFLDRDRLLIQTLIKKYGSQLNSLQCTKILKLFAKLQLE